MRRLPQIFPIFTRGRDAPSPRYRLLLIIVAALAAAASVMAASTEPKPSGTVPILYINTEEGQEIVSKEQYINAVYWLDPLDTGLEGLGDPEEPLPTQIRGRGNITWIYPKKPYKLKLGSKTAMLGMPKNKHWALLAQSGAPLSWLGPETGFEIAREIGLGWVPSMQPVELVLNDRYEGLYFLTETVRIDSNRLDIYEQRDNETDPELIEGGWLLECDNYDDPRQMTFDERGKLLRITYHTPEELSPEQSAWLESAITELVDAIYDPDKTSTRWSDLIDKYSWAKYFIINEIIDDPDAWNGSLFFHRDLAPDAKWVCGPLWDPAAEWRDKTGERLFTVENVHEYNAVHLIRELLKFPEFVDAVAEVWHDYYPTHAEELGEYIDRFSQVCKRAVVANNKRWPDFPMTISAYRIQMKDQVARNCAHLDALLRARQATARDTVALSGIRTYPTAGGATLSAIASAAIYVPGSARLGRMPVVTLTHIGSGKVIAYGRLLTVDAPDGWTHVIADFTGDDRQPRAILPDEEYAITISAGSIVVGRSGNEEIVIPIQGQHTVKLHSVASTLQATLPGSDGPVTLHSAAHTAAHGEPYSLELPDYGPEWIVETTVNGCSIESYERAVTLDAVTEPVEIVTTLRLADMVDFTDLTASRLPATIADAELTVSVTADGRIQLDGLAPGAIVSVYTLSGLPLGTHTAAETSLAVGPFHIGDIYLLTVNTSGSITAAKIAIINPADKQK